MNKLKQHVGFLLAFAFAQSAYGQVNQPGSYEGMRLKTIRDVRTALEPQLLKYCVDSCEMVKISADVREEVSETTEIGFEAISGSSARPKLYVEKIDVEIQVDDRVTLTNRNRLESILQNYLRGFAISSSILWKPVLLPNIGSSSGSAEFLRKKLEEKIASSVNRVIQAYCPNDCILGMVGVDGELVSLDDARRLTKSQQFSDATGRTVMKVLSAAVDVSMNSSLPENTRQQISNLIAAKTRYVTPLDLNLSVSQFPKTYAEKLRDQTANDPYGLEKLRQMLLMFRDLASTKEIITSTSSNNNSESSLKTESDRRNSSSTSSTNSKENSLRTKSQLTDSTLTSGEGASEVDWAVWGSLALAAIMMLVLILKFVKANQDAKVMLDQSGFPDVSKGMAQGAGQQGVDANGRAITLAADSYANLDPAALALKLKVEQLKDNLIKQFMSLPKVAKETFSRILKEDGVEEAAKYLQIFGQMVVLDLIDDPNLTRDLYALSEFYHNSSFEFTVEEEYELLKALKTKFTATEIKILSKKGSDRFEFLSRLDPAQIYTLITEEKSQIQSIVLTQLDKKRRMAVFDMYRGNMKLELMGELCKADAIPREFMINVAKALHKKVFSRPEFDTENIRSSEIIIDLLERSDLFEQRAIMNNLQSTNSDTARAIMMKLTTIEMLPYLKDGHLIEIVLGMEREDLLAFLSGTQDHIRDLLLSKAPVELAESWIEDLENMGSVDESNYRLSELKIFNKIRNLANSGSVSILDINEMIFDQGNFAEQSEQLGTLSSDSMVA